MSRGIKFEYVSRCVKQIDSINGVSGATFGEIRKDAYTLDEIQRGALHLHHIAHGVFELLARREYTGLKDKNGVEIYQDDIVVEYSYSGKDPMGRANPYRVFYDKGMYWMSRIGPPGNQQALGGVLFDERQPKLEVIGNIYENPELLQTAA